MYVYETDVISEIDSKEELDYIRFQFKNFEDRGYYFNQLIKKKFNGK